LGYRAACYDSYPALQNLTKATSSDSAGVGFALVGYFQDLNYRVLVGNFWNGSKLRNAPVSVLQSTNPLEVRVLKASDTDIAVAVLNGAEKKLSLVQYTFGGTPNLINISLEGLRIGSNSLTVGAPQLLSVNREAGELAFISVDPTSTKLVTM